MATALIYNAIKAKLVDDLGAMYPVRDFEEIEEILAQSGEPFLALEESDDDTESVSIGSPSANWLRDSGTIDVHVFVPFQNGLDPARQIADSVRAALQFQQFGGLPGFRTITVGQPSPGIENSGLWNSILVAVDYERTHAVATA